MWLPFSFFFGFCRLWHGKGFFLLAFCLFCTLSCVSSQKQKKKADLYHQKALSLMKKCQYPGAMAQFQKALKWDNKQALFHHSTALLYFQFKKYEKAIEHLKTALKLRPEWTSARVHLGRSLIETGRTKEGLTMLKKAQTDLTYRHVDRIHIHMGMAHYKNQDFRQAEKHFNVARTVQQEDCVMALYHAQSLYFLKQYPKALSILEPSKQWCQKKLPLCAKPSFDSYFFSALSYDKMGNRKKALQNLNIFLSKAKKSEHLKKAGKYRKMWQGD